MDFITMIVILGAGFLTINYVLELFEKHHTNNAPDDCRKTNTMHTWNYDVDGFMRCKVCNRKPFE